MKYIIVFYVVFMLCYWMQGADTKVWTFAYYLVEKGATASGFILLAVHVSDKRIMQLSLYMASICLFQTLFMVWCMIFGYDLFQAVTSFLFYSLIVLYLIQRK